MFRCILVSAMAMVGKCSPMKVCTGSFPDPCAFQADGLWYAIGTGIRASGRVFPMLESEDWLNWHPIEGAMDRPDLPGTDFWAPEVFKWGDRWRLVYSVGQGDRGHTLRIAESERPVGPYRDLGEPVLDPSTCGFAIDPHPYQHSDGSMWLFYARDFVEGPRPGTSLVVAPLLDGRRVDSEYVVVARASEDWQRYERNRQLYGRTLDWHTLEGPTHVIHEGRIWLFYSGGNWTNETYGVDWLTAPHPQGPWVADPTPVPRFLRSQPPLVGPGHNSFVLGPGGQTWTSFHAWDAARTTRQMWLGKVQWNNGEPSIS